MLEKIAVLVCCVGLVLGNPRPQGIKENGEVDICSLPPVNGPFACEAFIPRWTFNSAAKTCQQYIYGGCGGTQNLFVSEADCLAKCGKTVTSQQSNDELPKSDPCLLPKSAGDCRGYIPSFYFDSVTGNCESFVYTGCKGNGNRFESGDKCRDTCKAHLVETASEDVTEPQEVKTVKTTVKNEATGEGLTRQERCSLPPIKTQSPIACLAFIPSWTFNSTAGVCEPYVYGGCGKTANLYSSEQECKAACVESETRVVNPRQEACKLAVERGPCYAFIPRYAFIKEKNRCEYFTYGGCRGNSNNFKSATECYDTCGGDLPSIVSACEQVTCPASNQRFLDRGCRPVYKRKACCPSSFTCPDETNAGNGVCWYRGVSYSIGERIPQISEDNACQSGCKCVASSKHTGGATIRCNTMYCDEPFLPPGKTGCSLVTPPGACCPSFVCADEVPKNSTCSFNGKEYLPDESIPTGNPCKWCKCTEGFNGLDGPGCIDAQCLVENRIGCTPVYAPSVCCPISYKCLSDAELGKNKTRIIRIDPKPGLQGITTLPMPLTPEARDLPETQATPDHCYLPKEMGPCRMSKPSYYYDAAKEECIFFYYGGCKGNANRFESEAVCLSTCHPEKGASRVIRIESAPKPVQIVEQKLKPTNESCLLPKESGPCRMSLPSFFYDSTSGRCSPFLYGGCRGNANRFETLEDCERACVASSEASESATLESTGRSAAQEALPEVAAQDKKQDAPLPPARCLLPKQTGPCKMALESFYYDAEQKDCFPFYYGGCRGNENRFDTIENCRSSCKLEKNQTRPAVCLLEAHPGPCKGHVLAYFFNSRTENCETFWYGGCLGNQNNFASETECQMKCGLEVTATDEKREARLMKHLKRCELPADVGPCRRHEERYFYDKTEKKCKVFGYGGCLGNSNRFATEEDCMKACGGEDPAVDLSPQPAVRARTIDTGARAKVDLSENEIQRPLKQCKLGNVTFNLGDKVTDSSDPCEECICTTPPELTCTRTECPTFPDMQGAVCTSRNVPGQCCPILECVSANPPSIDVCQGVECAAGEQCEVQTQESDDGSWKPPVGVCVPSENQSV